MITTAEIIVGNTYTHKVHGRCLVVHKTNKGYWIQVWGGINGDKLYTFKGIIVDDLAPKSNYCSSCGFSWGFCEGCEKR